MKLIFAGDYCDNARVSQIIKNKEYETLFGNVKTVIESADYSVVNFEFPIVKGSSEPIQKCGPNLKGHINAVEAIKYAGFKCCTMANNHILDQGEKCGLETKEALEGLGLDTVGFGFNSNEAAKILYKRINGESLAILNCCEHEFSTASSSTAGANPLNPIEQYYSIQEARSNADFVIVVVHGGHEYFQIPTERMIKTYRFFVDSGADVVVNHHQHCYSGYEIYNGKPIFYGLGNFLFDWNGKHNSSWNEGVLLQIEYKNNCINFKLIPYTQCNEQPTVTLNTSEKFIFSQYQITEINNIIQDFNLVRSKSKEYYDACIKSELNRFEPYTGFISKRLFHRGYLKSTLTPQKLSDYINHIECESHRDRLIYALKNI